MASSSTSSQHQLAPTIHGLQMQPDIAIAQSLSLVNQTLTHILTKNVPEKRFSRQLMEILEQAGDPLSVLPLLTCEAVGGDSHQAIPVVAAWQLLRLSAKFLDDVVDGESAYPAPEAIDLAAGMLFLAPLVLEELQNRGVSTRCIEALTQSLYQSGLRACAGQHAEITSHNDIDPDGWLIVARTKSGGPCAWATWAGAMVADANEQALTDFHKFGLHLGILLQVADDFNGIWQPSKFSDLRSGQLNLAVCYASLVAKGGQKDFLETLLKNVIRGDNTVESEIQDFLIKIGAQAYMLVVGGEQRQQALSALQTNHRPCPTLVSLLDQIWPILADVESDGGHHHE